MIRSRTFVALTVLWLAHSALAQASSCPPEMAEVEDFCIDRWEARLAGQSPYLVPVSGVAESVSGVVPQGYISGDVAAAACASAGKRLCSDAEWLRACRGPTTTTYPYGDTYVAGACNDTRAVHPVIEVFGPDATFSSAELNDPQLNQLADSVDPTGANAACVTAEGVFDMHGNLNEWTSDIGGTYRGGYYVEAVINGPGCLYANTAHSFVYHDYSTGFRCCAEVGFAPPIPATGSRRSWTPIAILAATFLIAAQCVRFARGGTRREASRH